MNRTKSGYAIAALAWLGAASLAQAAGAQLQGGLAAGEAARAAAAASRDKKPAVKDDGRSLSKWVLLIGHRVSRAIHESGGYRFDGYNDCYGFVRRTWNPVLDWLRRHHLKNDPVAALPVADYPSPLWRPIADWDELIPGDVLGTVQGHRWGPDVDYGLYGGKRQGVHYQFSNGGGAGPRYRPQSGRYRFYYLPTHKLLRRLK